jgi:hypothetical protein
MNRDCADPIRIREELVQPSLPTRDAGSKERNGPWSYVIVSMEIQTFGVLGFSFGFAVLTSPGTDDGGFAFLLITISASDSNLVLANGSAMPTQTMRRLVDGSAGA